MKTVIAVLYLVAVALIVAAAFGLPARVSLALLGAGCGLLAFALHDIQAGFGH